MGREAVVLSKEMCFTLITINRSTRAVILNMVCQLLSGLKSNFAVEARPLFGALVIQVVTQLEKAHIYLLGVLLLFLQILWRLDWCVTPLQYHVFKYSILFKF